MQFWSENESKLRDDARAPKEVLLPRIGHGHWQHFFFSHQKPWHEFARHYFFYYYFEQTIYYIENAFILENKQIYLNIINIIKYS